MTSHFLDCSAILIPHLSQLQINKLQTVQNKAQKQIYKKESDKTLEQLHQLAKLDSIKTRFFKLTKNYIIKAVKSNNPIILDLIRDYKCYANGRILKHQTLLCPFKADIEIALEKLNESVMSRDSSQKNF